MINQISRNEPDFKYHELHVRMPSAAELNENDSQNDDLMMSFYLLGDYHDMKRSKTEETIKSLQRLARNCATKYEKQNKSKGKKKTPINADQVESQENKPYSMDYVVQNTFITKGNDSVQVDISNLKNESYESGMKIHIPIHKELSLQFSIVVNPPTILSLQTYPKTSYSVECPILPFVTFENGTDFECLWYIEEIPQSGNYKFISNHKVFVPSKEFICCKIKLFCTAFRYVNHNETIIYGRSFVNYLSGIIIPLPRSDQLLSRLNKIREDYHAIPRHQDYDLRILSYNILSEGYCQRENSINHLYGYCLPNYLETEYRIQRISRELLASNADIIGLQECDAKVFSEYLLPLLGAANYSGHYTNKLSSVREGCALFIQNQYLQLLQVIDIPIKNYLRSASYLQPLYQRRPDLQDVIGDKLGTIVQISILLDKRLLCTKKNHFIIVANTHLFYHPLCSYIRLLQTYFIMKKIEELITTMKMEIQKNKKNNDEKINIPDLTTSFDDPFAKKHFQEELQQEHSLDELFSKITLNETVKEHIVIFDEKNTNSEVNSEEPSFSVIFMGDLNSTPGVSPLQFLEMNQITPLALVNSWDRLSYFAWGKDASETEENSVDAEKQLAAEFRKKEQFYEENPIAFLNENDIGPLPIEFFQHSLNLVNTSKDITYTNYTVAFKELLDYIFISKDSFEVIRSAPMPSLEELQEETAMPSSVFPSDHLSIAIDVKYLSRNNYMY